MKSMRLDKFVSQAAGIARSEAKRVIGKSWIKVNGEVVSDVSSKVGLSDEVVFRREVISLQQDEYLMMNKPAGYICSAIDEAHPTALNLIDIKHKKDLHFAGRLDADTTGMILITNDGKWSHKVSSPRRKCDKTYRIWLAEPITPDGQSQLEKGVMLNNETDPTLPAKIQVIQPTEILLTINEGRYHQVKRMLAAVGNKVDKLHRESIGSLSLAGLGEGEWRALTEAEVAEFN